MYTQCPRCLTIYEIDEDALQASLGIVHCGRCNTRFDALRTLSDSLPQAPLTPLPRRDLGVLAPTLTVAVPPAAYESMTRRRHPQRQASEQGQHELTLPPAGDHAAEAPAASAADDWFADIESELTGDAPGVPPVDTGDEPAGAAAGIDAAPMALPDPLDAEPSSIDTAPIEDNAPPPEFVVSFPAPSMQAPVVSPPLLAGDVFGADGAATIPTDQETETTPADILEPHDDDPQITAAETAAVDASNTAVLDAPDVDDPSEPAAPEPVAPIADADAAVVPLPVYVRPRQRRLPARGLAWSAGCLLLTLLLAAQLAWADRVDLVRNPSTRGLAQAVCVRVPCRLPPIKDAAQLELRSRDVRPDPNAPGALTITATLRNNAGFRQPWPIVTVELTDFDNHAVAMRRFRAAEYMPDAARRAAGIAPGATVAVAFEVADPGKRAGGYRFSFE